MSQNSQSKLLILSTKFSSKYGKNFSFAPKIGAKGLFQNGNFQYAGRAENRIITTEDKLFGPMMFDNAKYGMKHTIPLSTIQITSI